MLWHIQIQNINEFDWILGPAEYFKIVKNHVDGGFEIYEIF